MDRNKTELTHQVTAAAVLYFQERGFKPIETEVPVNEFGIVDIGGVCEPTRGEVQALQLMKRRPRRSWDEVRRMSPARLENYRNNLDEWDRLYRALPRPLVAVVEVKTARQDFRRDQKWTKPSPADLRYVAVPRGLLRPGEAPTGWAIMEMDSAERIHLTVPPVLTPISVEKKLRIVLQIGMRHYNRHSYALNRDLAKQDRIRYNGEESRIRWSQTFRALLRIAKGGGHGCNSVEEVLRSYRIKHLPGDVQEGLQELWGIQSGAREKA